MAYGSWSLWASSPISASSSAVRDACDLGYLVTLVPDACAAYSQERHEASLRAIDGYCRQVGASALVEEISRQSKDNQKEGRDGR